MMIICFKSKAGFISEYYAIPVDGKHDDRLRHHPRRFGRCSEIKGRCHKDHSERNFTSAKVLPNPTDKFRRMMVGSLRMANLRRTWGPKPHLVCEYRDNRSRWEDDEPDERVSTVADGLAREGSHKDYKLGGGPTVSEIATRVKQDINSYWKLALVQQWYEGNHPGAALLGTGNRREEINIARLRSGHTQAEWHVVGLKITLLTQNAISTQAATAHIMTCIVFHNSFISTSRKSC
ncbi:hypothetical protein TNCV_1794291 [Trichonephila clavipes]|nr:hypothetical protein TNCV_1794291 [Trichonephila clavipes]